jgi:hypothetical protein
MDHAQVLILACIKFQALAVPYDARDEYLRYIAKPNNCEVAVVDSHWTSFAVDGTGKYGTWSPVEVTSAGYIAEVRRCLPIVRPCSPPQNLLAVAHIAHRLRLSFSSGTDWR